MMVMTDDDGDSDGDNDARLSQTLRVSSQLKSSTNCFKPMVT